LAADAADDDFKRNYESGHTSWRRGRSVDYTGGCSAGIVAAALIVDLVLCNGILKNIFARTRPFDVKEGISLLITAPKDFSFPSGHTAASFTAVAALYFAGEKKLWKISCAVAVLIAFSRMYLYVHYPTDILGGIIVGIVSGLVGAYIIKRVQKRGVVPN